MRLGILGSEKSPYVTMLQQAGEQHEGVREVTRFGFSDLQATCTGGKCHVDRLGELDAVIVRTMPLGTLEQVIFRMDCLHVLADNGVAIINSPRSLEVAIDKWLTLHRLQQAGVNVPKTVACQTREQALEAFDALGGDVVVKPLFGGEGRGILRVAESDLAWRVFSSLEQLGSVFYVQQYLQHRGFDVRVLFVGEKHFAMKRVAESGWRTNISQGSLPGEYELTEAELGIARRAYAAIGAEVAGVDLMPCIDEEVVALEVNAVPGWLGIQKVCREDIAFQVVDFAVRKTMSC